MSANVWYPEIDTAFVKFIKEAIQFQSDSGESIPVSVIVRKPDKDYVIDTYPCVSCYPMDSQYDLDRQDNTLTFVSKDIEAKEIVLEKSAIPFKLMYQVDFYALSQTDLHYMTAQWLSHVGGRDFNLPVVDSGGVERTAFALQMGDLVRADFLSNTSRTFHAVLTYRVYAEVDYNVRVTKPLITEVDNRINIKEVF